MKNTKSLIYIASLLLLFQQNSIFGQTTQKKFNIDSYVSFNKQSESTEIKFPVLQVGNLNMVIESNIKEGELTIELYDPQGEKQGNFTIGSPTFSSKESIRGSVSKKITNPLKGEWIVKFITKNASGVTEIICHQLPN